MNRNKKPGPTSKPKARKPDPKAAPKKPAPKKAAPAKPPRPAPPVQDPPAGDEAEDVTIPLPERSWRETLNLEGEFRAGFAALVGRPNVGKSTLLNSLLGHKLVATTPRPQTTRRRFRGILGFPGAQVILVDTPGLFEGALLPDKGKGGYGELGNFMTHETRSALNDVDVAVLVEEAAALPDIGPTPVQQALLTLLKDARKPTVLALNKIDRIPKAALLPILTRWNALFDFKAIIPVSATHQDGLDRLALAMAQLMPPSPPLFPEGELSDASERAICEELIREKVMMRTGEEIPYAAAVEIVQFDESRREPTGKKPGIVDLEATIHVERDGQKAIVVGAGGKKIKEIGILAREELERFLGCKVMLRLFVKVSDHWSRNKNGLRSMGYH